MSSVAELRDVYQHCVGWFLLLTKTFENDSTGQIGKMALDGALLIFWAQLVGLDKGQLDPQLARFQGHIESEFRQLLSCFETLVEDPVGHTIIREEHISKSHLPNDWIVDALNSNGKELATTTVAKDNITRIQISHSRDRLGDLSSACEAVCKSMPRLLSGPQREILRRKMTLWKAKRLNEDSPELLEALSRAARGRDDEFATIIHGRIHSYEEDKKIDSRLLSKVAIRTEDLRWAIPRSQVPEILLRLSDNHAVGEYQGMTVFVEQRTNRDWKAEGSKALEIFLRIDSLAAKLSEIPKPATFCTLNCLGYFSDRQDREYAFVYAWPCEIREWTEKSKPKTLHQLLVAGRDTIGPSLTFRVDLARRLAECLMTFHISGWLHKSINSHNVVSFPHPVDDDEGLRGILHPERMYLTGFEYSRQDGLNYVTESVTQVGRHDLYRHPEVTSFERRSAPKLERGTFQKSHDLYALGLLLAEIGLWDQIGGILADFYHEHVKSENEVTDHTPTPYEFHDWVVRSGDRSLEALLQYSTGNRYTSAVMACVRGNIRDGLEYVNELYSKVIEPLKFCSA